MCHFITAALPKDVHLEKIKKIFKSHHLGFREIENLSVAEHLEKDDHYILTTKGICDCGTVLASPNSETYNFDGDQFQKYIGKSVEKLKAKGWSEMKIRR